MAFKLEWSEEALEDIESIATYIEKDSPIYARSVVSKIFEKAEILQEFLVSTLNVETRKIKEKELIITIIRVGYRKEVC